MAFLLLILLFSDAGHSGTALILPFENQTKNPKLDWIGESFVEGLTDVLRGVDLHVATREERAAAFDQLGIPASSILSRATIIRLAETMDADFVVVGQFTLPHEGQLRAGAQILELRPPRLSAPFTETGLLRDLLLVQERLGMSLWRTLPVSRANTERHAPVEALPIKPPPSPRRTVRLEAWENYIRGLLVSNKQQAAKYFLEAVRIDSDFARPAFHLGKIYVENRDYPTAVPWLSKVKEDHPNYLEATFLLGICYFFQEDYAKAEAAFRTVADRLPLDEVYNNLGVVLARRGRSGAIELLRKAAETDPSNATYQFNLGFLNWKNGQLAQAVRRLRLALERRPNDVEARALLMKVLDRSGNAPEAAREREILMKNPAAARLLNADDKVFEQMERIERNYDELSFRQLQTTLTALSEENLSRQPAAEHAEVHLQRGRELFREQDDPAALAELTEAVRLDPIRAEAYLLMARIHERNGRAEEAIREANRALGRQNSVDAHLLLAKIYLEQDKRSEARRHAQEALQLQPSSMAARSVLKTIEMREP